MRLLRCLFLFSFVAPSLALLAQADVQVENGEIAGAKFAIARPEKWNGSVLLMAHGLRNEGKPLVADLFPSQQAYKALLNEGWIVAKTSYRRNGIIIADAIADLDSLRAYIAEQDGEPKRVILEGESMGGLIVTLMAERNPQLYAGAVAIGAALRIEENGTLIPISGRPQIPLIFLTNQSELDGPAAYVTAAATAAAGQVPVLFRVSRDGHVNVNQAERLVAFRTLNAWLDLNRSIVPKSAASEPWFDATVKPRPQPSQVTLADDRRSFTTRVIEISAIYGNIFINAQPSDFAALGIEPGTWFELEAHGKTHRVFYGKDFSSVKKGEWVIFGNADGFFWLARNYDDAATSAGIKKEELITIRRATK